MTIINDKVTQIIADADLLHQVANGDATTVVQTENGPVRSVAKLIADNQATFDAIPPALAGVQQKVEKDVAGGYVGLSGNKIRIRDLTGAILSGLYSLATATRDYVLQDRDGTIAFLDDIKGTNSGINTGDETQTTILQKLQVDSLSGINTGDQTLDQLGGQPKLTFIPADSSTIGQAGGLAPLDNTAKIAAIYLPSYVDDVMEYDTYTNFPQPGERGKIYVTLDENLTYRWSGTSYIQLVSSPGTTDSIAEGSGSLYFTQARVLATPLTGYTVAVNQALSATDTILVAFARLQQQITDLTFNVSFLAPKDSPNFTGVVIVPTMAATDSSSNAANTLFTQNAIGLALGTVVTAKMGVANGIAPLGADAKIAALYLPSYVDDVLEFATLTALPATGETGKIYVTLDTNFEYRWSGSVYIRLVASPGSTDAVPEGSVNLYYTPTRVINAVLAGLSVATGTTVLQTDSVLAGIGKLQAQLTALITAAATKVSPIFSGTMTTNATAVNNAFATLLSVDLTADVITTVANHGFNSGDYIFYNATTTGMTIAGNAYKSVTYYVNPTAVNKFTLHASQADALAGVNPLDISVAGAGVETFAFTSRAIALKTSSGGNTGTLETISYRYAAGTTWQSVATRLQYKTDNIFQAYMEFNPSGNQYGMKMGAPALGKIQMAIDNAVLLTIDQAGVHASGDLQLNGVSVATMNLVGLANGIAPLGSDAKIAAIYLPSYVDDVLEFANVAALPTTGESGKIYVTLDTNFEYRWSGSVYIRLVASPGSTDSIAEGTTNLYFTLARVLGAVLTGFSTATTTVVSATDTVLSAIGKLQAQISAIPYDIASGMGGKPAASDFAIAHVAIRPFTIAVNAPLAKAVVGVAPTASYAYALQKNGTVFCTITFAAGATVGTIAMTAATSFASGDVMKIVAATTTDTTVSDLSFTFTATLN